MIDFSGVRVELARKKMTQKRLAEITGIRPPTVSKIFLGTISRVPVNALNKICKVLGCQPGDLMTYVPDEPDAE